MKSPENKPLHWASIGLLILALLTLARCYPVADPPPDSQESEQEQVKVQSFPYYVESENTDWEMFRYYFFIDKETKELDIMGISTIHAITIIPSGSDENRKEPIIIDPSQIAVLRAAMLNGDFSELPTLEPGDTLWVSFLVPSKHDDPFYDLLLQHALLQPPGKAARLELIVST